MTMDELMAVFGWMTLINVAIYTWAALWIVLARDWTSRLQARIMGVPEAAWPGYFTDFLSRYKLLIIVFNLAPYLALRIVV